MNSEQSSPSGPERPARWPIWVLGALSAAGLLGFVVTFGFVMARTTAVLPVAAPNVPASAPDMQRALGQPGQSGPQGERGPAGPAGPIGPRGAAGDAGIRILRAECATGNCTMECDNDEVLLTAHCGVGRAPAVYPTQHSALCRSPSRAKVEIVVACVRSQRR